MEDDMNTEIALPPRRGFFGRIAGAVAIGLTGIASQSATADAAKPADDGPHWPGKLTARHRMVFDTFQINGGRPLDFAYNFMSTNPPGTALSVVILRAGAVVMAVNDEIWARYKVGEAMKVTDPATKAPAVKNLFTQPGLGMVNSDDATISRMLAAGVVIGACNLALHGVSKMLAHNAGVDADTAAKEWLANVAHGITVVPSGVWGVGRAQEAGCGYCSGG
jgi:intracellular sulfur oxidation DsrE/DsrF family protein